MTGGRDSILQAHANFSFALQDSGLVHALLVSPLDAPCTMPAGSHVAHVIPGYNIQLPAATMSQRGAV